MLAEDQKGGGQEGLLIRGTASSMRRPGKKRNTWGKIKIISTGRAKRKGRRRGSMRRHPDRRGGKNSLKSNRSLRHRKQQPG